MFAMYKAFISTCRVVVMTIAVLAGPAPAIESQCFGTTSNGRIENAVKLPANGVNFLTYSALGHTAGRTYVHTTIADIIATTYKTSERETPSVTYVYGETGWA
jgi:penicillin-insensitive murein DD-endopeptidase